MVKPLKDCPHCGCAVELKPDGLIVCPGCGSGHSFASSLYLGNLAIGREAIKLWNERASEVLPPAEPQKLVLDLSKISQGDHKSWTALAQDGRWLARVDDIIAAIRDQLPGVEIKGV